MARTKEEINPTVSTRTTRSGAVAKPIKPKAAPVPGRGRGRPPKGDKAVVKVPSGRGRGRPPKGDKPVAAVGKAATKAKAAAAKVAGGAAGRRGRPSKGVEVAESKPTPKSSAGPKARRSTGTQGRTSSADSLDDKVDIENNIHDDALSQDGGSQGEEGSDFSN